MLAVNSHCVGKRRKGLGFRGRGEGNSVNFLIRLEKSLLSRHPHSLLPLTRGTIWAFVPTEETGAVAPQGKHEEERVRPTDTGCPLPGHPQMHDCGQNLRGISEQNVFQGARTHQVQASPINHILLLAFFISLSIFLNDRCHLECVGMNL